MRELFALFGVGFRGEGGEGGHGDAVDEVGVVVFWAASGPLERGGGRGAPRRGGAWVVLWARVWA